MTDGAPDWRLQYERTRRWQARLREERPVDDQFVDDCYAFFTCCFHLKDWLCADGSTGLTRGEVEGYVEGNLWLRLCADLANVAKHGMVSSRPHYEGQPRADITGVVIPGTAHDHRHVVSRCMRQWEEFLTDRGLLATTC